MSGISFFRLKAAECVAPVSLLIIIIFLPEFLNAELLISLGAIKLMPATFSWWLLQKFSISDGNGAAM